jgi:carotenoid cleavage dioxygenase-like enzyme
MKKDCKSESQVHWFTLPCHYVFHYVNAWEEQNDKGQTVIKLVGCPQVYVDLALTKEHPFFEDENFNTKLAAYTFNLVTGEATERILVDGLSLEFPVIN